MLERVTRHFRDGYAGTHAVDGPAVTEATELLARHTPAVGRHRHEATAHRRFIATMIKSQRERTRRRELGLDRDDGDLKL